MALSIFSMKAITGCSRGRKLWQDSVSKWRSRFIKRLPLLQEIAEKDPSSLEKAVSSFLDDSPRPGQPMHYTDEQIIKILETACRNPDMNGLLFFFLLCHMLEFFSTETLLIN